MRGTSKFSHGICGIAALLSPAALLAQTAPLTRQQIQTASETERAREMAALGITALRPTVGARDPAAADFANFDEARANPYPNLPPLLITRSGERVKNAGQWRTVRRPEI